MMASQINPHFLFNALESIRMKAHIHGEKEISQIVRLLGKLMRKNLEIHGGKIPLKSEIEMIKCYLEIQKFRYEDRLNYELLVDPLAENVMIPALIIRPLVENAVIHGIENREEGGMIQVRVEECSDKICVQVIDNGIGMSEEKIQYIKATLDEENEEESNRIGLTNVHMRLQLTYGQKYGLVINSTLHIGTNITFTLPKKHSGNMSRG